MGRIAEIHTRIGSTNDRAMRLAKDGAVHGVTVVALEQTKGRGQYGRTWHSPPGAGLYASFILRPTLSPRLAPALTILAGVAVREAVQPLVPVKLGIKWPNDLLVAEGPLSRRKLGGILVEATTGTFRIEHAVVGVGINLDDVERPAEIAETAASLEALGAHERSPEAVLGRIAGALERRLDQATTDGLAPIARDFTKAAVMRGERVVVTSDGERHEGVMLGIAEDGALLIDTAKGPRTLYRGALEPARSP
jgi:BirA family biotin operon repressor/biotin-[acetyl-CoA-carboxylase] ligase